MVGDGLKVRHEVGLYSAEGIFGQRQRSGGAAERGVADFLFERLLGLEQGAEQRGVGEDFADPVDEAALLGGEAEVCRQRGGPPGRLRAVTMFGLGSGSSRQWRRARSTIAADATCAQRGSMSTPQSDATIAGADSEGGTPCSSHARSSRS